MPNISPVDRSYWLHLPYLPCQHLHRNFHQCCVWLDSIDSWCIKQ